MNSGKESNDYYRAGVWWHFTNGYGLLYHGLESAARFELDGMLNMSNEVMTIGDGRNGI